MPQTHPAVQPSEATLKRMARKDLFDKILVERFHAAFSAEQYSDALQLMEIRDRLEARSALGKSYF